MKLFIITQTVDSAHPVLGFFVEWIRAFRKHPAVSSLDVVSFDSSSETVDDASVHRIAPRGRLGRVREVWSLLRSADWDVLFVHMTPVWCVACWPVVAWKRKKMVLWYTHGSAGLMLRLACGLCSEVYTATSEAFPVASKNIFTAGHGIPEYFGSVVRPSGEKGNRYLAVGRLARRKRVIETLELFSKIRAQDPSAVLTWAGPPSGDTAYDADIRDAIARLGLASSVRLEGPVAYAQTPRLYGSHDALIHLSATGSLDKVAVEALMAGCAVFSTNRAIGEGLGESWVWRGGLDDAAATEAIRRARRGVPDGIRAGITGRYGLTSFIDRLVRRMTTCD